MLTVKERKLLFKKDLVDLLNKHSAQLDISLERDDDSYTPYLNVFMAPKTITIEENGRIVRCEVLQEGAELELSMQEIQFMRGI